MGNPPGNRRAPFRAPLNPTEITKMMYKTAKLVILALATAMILAACGRPEGMLSDEEKLERAAQGRADFMQGMQGGAPPAAGQPGAGPAAPGQAAPGQAAPGQPAAGQ